MKEGFPVPHTANVANTAILANLANLETGAAHLPSPGSVTVIHRKQKGREREEGRRGKEGRLVSRGMESPGGQLGSRLMGTREGSGTQLQVGGLGSEHC